MAAPESRTRSVTIRDVAEKAGVSTATVSRALAGRAGVGPATRERVIEAARVLHYRPSGIARSLKLRATRTLGLIVTDVENPFFPQVIRAVEDAAREAGYSVLLADGRGDPAREIESLENLASLRVDGLLVASSALTERHRDWLDAAPCPVVIINGDSNMAGVPAVLSDNRAGGRLAADHVADLGHGAICYLAAPRSGNAAVGERLDGVVEALSARGMGRDRLEVVEGDGSVEGGESAAVLALRAEPATTALICYNDMTAVGALRGLRSLGRRVPADVSVVGFDDIEIAGYVDPPLTTIRQRTEDIGRWAVRALLAMSIDGHRSASADVGPVDAAAVVQRIEVELVVRASTGPVPSTLPKIAVAAT